MRPGSTTSPRRLRIFCPMRRWPILRPVPVSRHRKVALFYDTLSPLLKAALLNLFTKSSATTLVDDTTVFSKLGVMIKLKQDRLFAKTGAALLEETMQDTFFHHADD